MGDLVARLQSALGDAYRIERELGGGGRSRVYLAQETALKRQVVIKVLPPEMAAGVNVERFRREVELAASLQHPHIVPLLSAAASGDLLYYTLPLVAAESLRATLAAQVTQTPQPVTAQRPAVPGALNALVMRCLEKHPADRFQSAGAVLEALEQMVTPSGGITPTGSAPYDAVAAAAAARAHPLRVAGLFALTSVAVLGVVYFLMNQLGLPGWVMPGAVGLLVAGLPIMVVTGLIERRRALARTTGHMTTPPAGGLHGWLTWRKAVAGGVAAFAALGLGAAGYSAMRLLGIGPVGTLVASGVLEKRDRLVLADFENRTTDSTLGPSLTEALRVDLAQSPVVRLLHGAAVAQAP